ncbi:MAG: DNA polymerase/3'-5' exonuclease PolX [Deltaproteobacteria bacterium]|nr:DNA polymerase/3'-5' exonuclease PolX [Deltaproteobacteria bacterium]
MENVEIARIFAEIAELLEMKDEDRFRIRSYRNAALVIEGHTESLKTLYEKGGEDNLKHIHGVGESIRSKIVELLTTGRCAYHDEFLKELPAGLFDILKISGIGPKKAAQLYKELGISTVDELERAAKGERLRELAGFGEKTEKKILKGIAGLKAASGRFKLSVALPYAESFVAHIKKAGGAIDVVPAGSLRRWKETVGDLDILVTCANAGPVMEAFVSHPDVKEITAKGPTKSTVVLKAGLQVDIRVLEKEAFGAALQYFTGSKAHNVALRDRAKKMGLKISEYGVFDGKGRRVAGESEEDVYRAVGLPWISPELRENMGEIEAALEGRLPKELCVKDIRGDLHLHTDESDGGNTLEEMAEAAMALGYEYIAVTDHSRAVGVAHGLDEKRAIRQMEAIDGFNARLEKKGIKFRALKGAEVDIRADGTLDHPDAVLDRLDCVVGAIHSSFNMELAEMTARIIKGIRSNRLHIFAHPTGRLINSREPYQIDMAGVMDEAKKYGVAMELNSHPDRLDLNDVHCRLAREKGVMVAISTDAHSTGHLRNISYGIHTARRGWLEKKDVLNTKTLKGLMKALKRG